MNEYIISLSFNAEPNVCFLERIVTDNIFKYRFLTFINPFTNQPSKMYYKKISSSTNRPIYFYKEGTHEGGILSG